jgi:sporulation protein YunB
MSRLFKIFKNKLTVRQKVFVGFLIFFFLIFLLLNYLNTNVNPIIISASEAKVRSLSNKAVNEAIGEVVSSEVVYDSLIKIEEDEEGKISLIQANPIAINALTKQLMEATLTNLENMGESGVQIPLGSFSGVAVLNGFGPKVRIRIVPVGSVNANFISEFKSAGINQTNHKIYVNLETNVSLVLPLATKKISTVTQMLICESIIVGEVPVTYLNSTSLDEVLNLVPDA